METCVVEVGLLKKKPCGANAVAKCANCEIALCAKHTAGLMSGGKKVQLCPDCAKAWKAVGDIPTAPVAAAPRPAAAAPVAKAATPPKPAAVAAKPVAVAAKPAAVAAKPPAKEEKKDEHKPDDDAPLEFTPTKK